MPREQARGIGQAKNLRLDATEEGVWIAAGQIGAANAILKDQIAAKADTRLFGPGSIGEWNVKDAMAGSVTGRKANLQTAATQLKDLPMKKIDGGLGTGIDLEAEERSAAFRTPEDVVSGMQGHQRQRVETIGDGARAADVIEVCVRIPKVRDAPAALLRFCQDDVTIPRWDR